MLTFLRLQHRFGYGFGGTGMKSNNKQFDAYGEAFGKSDVIGCILNLDKGQISFEKNGKDLGVAFRIHDSLRNRAIFPAIVLKNAEMTINFGHQPLRYLPANCTPICKAASVNISINTITSKNEKNGGDTKHKILNAPQAIIIEVNKCISNFIFDVFFSRKHPPTSYTNWTHFEKDP